MREVEFIKIETLNKKELLLCEPVVSSNNTLDMLLLGAKDSIIKYERKENRVIAELGDKKWLVKISDEDLMFLAEYFDKEFHKANDYFNRLRDNKVQFILVDDIVTTEELLNSGFSAYYLKLTEYILNQKKTSLEDLRKKCLNNEITLTEKDNHIGKHSLLNLTL